MKAYEIVTLVEIVITLAMVFWGMHLLLCTVFKEGDWFLVMVVIESELMLIGLFGNLLWGKIRGEVTP